MHWQTTITCLAIGAACVYLAWRFVNSLRASKTGCAGGCGCAKSKPEAQQQPALIPPESLSIRRR